MLGLGAGVVRILVVGRVGAAGGVLLIQWVSEEILYFLYFYFSPFLQ